MKFDSKINKKKNKEEKLDLERYIEKETSEQKFRKILGVMKLLEVIKVVRAIEKERKPKVMVVKLDTNLFDWIKTDDKGSGFNPKLINILLDNDKNESI